MKIIEVLRKELADDYFQIENNEALSADEKVRKLIRITCVGCAGVAATPIPIADFFLLTPIQGYMGYKISVVRGFPVTQKRAGEVAREVLGVIGLGLVARQIASSTLKFIPIWGSVANAVVVYGLTYAVGQVMDYYFTEKAAGRSVAERAMKKIFKDARSAGEREAESFAKDRAGTGERESEITRTFLEAKDRFVKDARKAFEEMYGNFTTMVRDNFGATEVKEDATAKKAEENQPAAKSVKKRGTAVKKGGKKPAKKAVKKPVRKGRQRT
jgi:uncharacterized protein (DUF697 family)